MRVSMTRISALALGVVTAPALADQAKTSESGRNTVAGTDFIGEVIFPTATVFDDTQVGGLSALAFDSGRDLYYALSDDRSDARFYTIAIDLDDGALDDGDIVFQTVTRLIDSGDAGFADGAIDPEGLVLQGNDQLIVSSEGDASATPPIDPFIRLFAIDGSPVDASFAVPTRYLPAADGERGIRNNLAFESLTLSPDQNVLTTALENALVQDGPAADLDQPSLSRMLRFDSSTGEVIDEVVYEVDAVPDAPEPADAFRTNGLVELLAIDDNGTYLALERAFSVGVGNTVRLYEVLSQGALDTSSLEDLFDEANETPFEIDPAVQKRLLVDFADLPLSTVDNLEALAFGPMLDDGRQTLIIASDNNFNDTQVTQFIALALDIETIAGAQPVAETPQAVDQDDANSPLRGDSDDPAIYVAKDTRRSLVLATQKDGGLVVFDLNGSVLQIVQPAAFGEIRYNNVDIIYDFKFGDKKVDIAVASDRENDTIAIFKIDPKARNVVDITSANVPATIFGVDDGEATAYGLATYRSPKSGKSYAFVTQADGAKVAQLELVDDGDGKVAANIVRLLDLPLVSDDPADSQSEGIVVDRDFGLLYVSLEEEVGVLRFDAEPDGADTFDVVISIDHPALVPDIEGLIIAYGKKDEGVLIVSSQGDSSYAVFKRGDGSEQKLDFLGSFVITASDGIDQANESDGLDIANTRVGKQFSRGLLVVQDGADDPQVVVQDEEELENSASNFKFVPWERVAKAFDPNLPIGVGGPRRGGR